MYPPDFFAAGDHVGGEDQERDAGKLVDASLGAFDRVAISLACL